MSYNNNYSYFNGPVSNNDWWGANDSKKSSSFDESRVVKIDYNNQPYAQNYMQNYAQSMILPSENRPVEPLHPRHEVLQGTVTQLFSAFGYINDNIIFSKTDVTGPMVKVGDRVAVDATYQPNNPTKYKGERVCKIDDSRFTGSTNNLSKMKPLSRDLSSRIDIPLTIYHPETGKYDLKSVKKSEMKLDKKFEKKLESPRRSSAPKETKQSEPKKFGKLPAHATTPGDLNKVEAARKTASKRSMKLIRKRKSRSSSKSHKSGAKQPIELEKSAPKVVIEKLPKPLETFSLRELDCASLKFRCKSLQPPSQFFHVSLKYQQIFPLNHPMKLGNSCHFKVMEKRVKCIDNYINDQLYRDVDPEDADTTFSAKVMLLSTDELAEFYKQTLALAEEFDSTNKVPITKAIKFLVGNLGPNKEFAFGGAWSPSLDGPDPDNNPRVLINTAIRTCKNLTGIDLSGCSSWPKFLEIHYYRPLQKIQKKTNSADNKLETKSEAEPEERFEYIEPRMETVVYYVPDIWNCVPSQESWNEIRRMYQEQLTSLMCPPPSIPLLSKPVTSNNNGSQDGTQAAKKTANDNQEEEDYNFNENEDIDEKSKDSEQSINNDHPTHYSNLNVDGLKIVEIRRELELRKLSVKGVMDQLKARLKSALEKEETEEKLKDSQVVIKPTPDAKLPAEVALTETDKTELKQMYNLPDVPHIVVHHNQKYQDNKMKIKTMSLHSLLSYYDLKLDENTFEVALFAKQFLEMLRRDAVFNIYKCLVVTSEIDLVSKEDTSSNSAKKPKLMVTTSKRTVNRPLLFSCCLLDREKTNKIPLDDLKCLIEGLGICLSSDQLTALLNKVKDSSKCLHYRLLTDKEIDDDDMTKMLTVDQTDDLDYIRELAMGNKALFDEGTPMDTSVDHDEVDRLKNELDKSERCRQTLELRFSEIKEEAEKHKTLMQTQNKDIQKLKEQVNEYRTKYHQQQDRGDYYKKDFDKIYRDMKDIDKLAVGLSKHLTDSIEKYKKSEKSTKSEISKSKSTEKKIKPKDSKTSNKSKSNTEQNSEKDEATSSQKEATKSDEPSFNDIEMSESAVEVCTDEKENTEIEKSEGNLTNEKSSAMDTGHENEDFELSKPSDYEIIILDETE